MLKAKYYPASDILGDKCFFRSLTKVKYIVEAPNIFEFHAVAFEVSFYNEDEKRGYSEDKRKVRNLSLIGM